MDGRRLIVEILYWVRPQLWHNSKSQVDSAWFVCSRGKTGYFLRILVFSFYDSVATKVALNIVTRILKLGSFDGDEGAASDWTFSRVNIVDVRRLIIVEPVILGVTTVSGSIIDAIESDLDQRGVNIITGR